MANDLVVNVEADVDDLESGLDNIKSGLAEMGKAAAVAGVAIVAGIGAATIAATMDAETGLTKLQTQTGMTSKETEKLGKVMKDTYQKGFGESMTDISEAMALVKQQSSLLGISSAKDIQKTTENALTLRDTFDIDLQGSVTAAGKVVKNFGIKGEEAFDIIAKGMQMGLNQSGDFVDVLNEYSPHFSRIGLKANDMFNILKKGSESGVFMIDQVADSFHEFGIIVSENGTGAQEAMKTIGLSANEMQKAFLTGGEAGRNAFYKIIESLGKVKDPQERHLAGLALFGTMWEEVGEDAVLAMGKADSSITKTKGTIDEINKVGMSGITSDLKEFKRNLETNILIPIGQSLLPKLRDWTSKLDDVKLGLQMSGVIDMSQKDLEKYGSTVSETAENTKNLVKALKGTAKALVTIVETSSKILKFFSDLNKAGKDIGEGKLFNQGGGDLSADIARAKGENIGTNYSTGILSKKDEVYNSFTVLGDTTKLDRSAESFSKGNKTVNSFSSGISSASGAVSGALIGIGNNIGKLDKSGSAASLGSKNTGSFATGISSGSGSVSGAVNSVGNNVNKFNKSGESRGFGGNVAQSFANGINGGYGSVAGASSNVSGATKNMANVNLHSSGQTIVQQLINGINSMLGSLKKTCSGIAQAIRNFFPSSPAKWGALRNFPETGRTLMEQLMSGIESEKNNVIGVTSNIVSSIKDSVVATPNAGNKDSNTVIPIYLDGTKIASVIAPKMTKMIRTQGGY